MALDVEERKSSNPAGAPDHGFALRLEASLDKADHERRRHDLLRRLQFLLPVAILLIPILIYRFAGAGHDGLDATINAVAWTTFLLDVGVHIDSGVLDFLGLRLLPAIVGCLIFVLVGMTLLYAKAEEK